MSYVTSNVQLMCVQGDWMEALEHHNDLLEMSIMCLSLTQQYQTFPRYKF